MIEKSNSPFYPGQIAPIYLFIGRQNEIDRIVDRGAKQVAAGKPQAFFVQGDYGIGKSSLARYTSALAEKKFGLQEIYVTLGGMKTLGEVAAAILQSVVQIAGNHEKLTKFLSKYISEINLFNIVKVNTKTLHEDAPNISTPAALLAFLAKVNENLLADTPPKKGIFLILDEINGIAGNAEFSQFIKGLVDINSFSKSPLPLLLMLCGVEDRRREMISQHQPIDRIFNVIDLAPMSSDEVSTFYRNAFDSVHISVDEQAVNILARYSDGLPKIMHTIGDCAYWVNQDQVIDKADALEALISAADEIGQRFLQQQVIRTIRSEDYRSILTKIANKDLKQIFSINSISEGLTDSEKKKLNNFLQKMKKLDVIKNGDVRGEYIFTLALTPVYLRLAMVDANSTLL